MDASRWARVNEVFNAALDLSGDARSKYLVETCASDDALLSEVRSLLDAEAKSRTFFATPAATITEGAAPVQVGPWRVVKELGRGGMGTVYLAERSDGAFTMRAALKVLRRGLDTDDLLARFRAERQILASLQHPNIARLLDGGATDDGRPYLVMEFIDGEELLGWCTRNALDVNARLALFEKLTDAVQYAHRNLIVHRDLKPGNILVTATGELKLLDFGIAKVLDAPGDAAQTRTGQLLLTPAYASPEQVRAERVTTASDVWALGVVLSELLTGRRPFEGQGEALALAILEQDPVAPGLGGDLDNILLTALRKEPDRRYGSVEQFAADLSRHLRGLPVHARPATFGYRLSKFVNRNRWALVASSLIGLSLVGGVVSTLVQARQARAARLRAEASRARAEELVDFMLGDLRHKLEPTSRLDVLEDVSRAVQTYFASLPAEESSPERRARVLQQLANVRLAQAKGDDAAALVKESRTLLETATPGPETTMLLAAAANLQGRVLEERGELEPALAQFERCAALFEPLTASQDPLVLSKAGEVANDRGRVLYFLGRPAEAVTAHQLALDRLKGLDLQGREPRLGFAKSWLYLGRAQEGLGAAKEAEVAFRENLTEARALRKSWPEDLELEDFLAVSLNDLGRITRLGGHPEEAEQLALEALSLAQLSLARDPENAIRLDGLSASYSFLGRAREDQGKLDGALTAFGEDVKLSEKLLAKEPENAFAQAALADGLTNVGRVERKVGQVPKARAAHSRALALREVLVQGDSSFQADVGVSRLELGRLLKLEGKDPAPEWNIALGIFSELGNAEDSPAKQRGRLAQVLIELGRLDEARGLVTRLMQSGACDAELRALASARGL